jgi:hypothetical protein
MKNDLTTFEKNLLRAINTAHKTNYTHHHFMEWCISEELIKKNLQDGEIVYEALGVFAAINPKQEDKQTAVKKPADKITVQIFSTDPAINIDQSFEVKPHAIKKRNKEQEKKIKQLKIVINTITTAAAIVHAITKK